MAERSADISDIAAAHLARTGSAMLLERATKIRLPNEVHGIWPIAHHIIAHPGEYEAKFNPHGAVSVETLGALLGIKPNEFEWIPPHAVGDVIQIGEHQATVVEVLPPVRVEQLTAEDIEATGIDVAGYLPVVLKPGVDPDRVATWAAHCQLRQRHPNLLPTTYVWRVMLTAADAAGGTDQ